MEVFHMINYTADCYEMKRESVKFAENLTKNWLLFTAMQRNK